VPAIEIVAAFLGADVDGVVAFSIKISDGGFDSKPFGTL